jgi:hypothetical protein
MWLAVLSSRSRAGHECSNILKEILPGGFRLLEPVLSHPLSKIEIENELNNAKRLLESKV